MKPTLRKVHRYVAFALGLLWLSQALTGLVMVFRWELDDATVPAAYRPVPFDLDAFGARIAAIEASRPGTVVAQAWNTGGVAGRYDLYVDYPDGTSDVVRVDGRGQVLRHRTSDWDWRNGGLISMAADLHQTLFAGQRGKWLIGLSGLFLVSSIVMGAVLAWPLRAKQWRAVLAPKHAKRGVARRYAWHRAAGLWFALPALVLLSAGVLLTIDSSLERWLGLDETPPELKAAPPLAARTVTPPEAIRTAWQRYPAARMTGIVMPTRQEPWYRMRLRQPGEWRHVYGNTMVYVAAATGQLLHVDDALNASPRRAFVNSLYPVHTGEAAGIVGRGLSFAVGSWLLTMLVLGFGLWLARRR